jgi:hypothetical protein
MSFKVEEAKILYFLSDIVTENIEKVC